MGGRTGQLRQQTRHGQKNAPSCLDECSNRSEETQRSILFVRILEAKKKQRRHYVVDEILFLFGDFEGDGHVR